MLLYSLISQIEVLQPWTCNLVMHRQNQLILVGGGRENKFEFHPTPHTHTYQMVDAFNTIIGRTSWHLEWNGEGKTLIGVQSPPPQYQMVDALMFYYSSWVLYEDL